MIRFLRVVLFILIAAIYRDAMFATKVLFQLSVNSVGKIG